MKKFKMLLSFAIALCSVGVLSSGGMEVKNVEAEETPGVYTHAFTTKPSTGNNITLSGVEWTISATTLNGYNKDYAGVQFGSSKANGSINLKSSGDWEYNEKYNTIKSIELYLNRGGSSVTPSVKIGGIEAKSDGVEVLKTYKIAGDWKKATKVTFTPDSTKTGIVEINIESIKAGYIGAMVITAEEGKPNPSASISIAEGNEYTKVNGDNIKFTSELKNVETAPDPVYTSSDETIARFEGNELVPVKSGKVTATVTYTVGEKNYSNSIDVVIYPDNTNPLTVAEALQVCELTGTTEAPYEYTVRGIVDSTKFYDSNSTITAEIKDFGGEDLLKIYKVEVNSSSDIVVGEYYSFTGGLFTYVDKSGNKTPEMQNLAIGDYEKLSLIQNDFQKTTVSSQLSFAFEKDAEGTFGGFTNMSLNFRTNFDFSAYTKGTDFTEAGMMIVQDSDVSAEYSKKTAEVLPKGAKKATQTNYGKEFIVRLEDIPVANWETQVTVVPYILIEGTYYFGTAGVTSVIETAAAYASSDATITLSDGSVVNVRDVAAAIKN